MASILKNDHFDYLSDDLFSDDEDELNITKLENKVIYGDDSSQSSEPENYAEQRYQEKKKLFEIYMSDPTIPNRKKTGKDFLLALYNPTYSTQRAYKIYKNHLLTKAKNEMPKRIEVPIRPKKTTIIEGFGYDPTFFAPTEVLLAEQRKIQDIPKPIREIYQEKGIVTASQIYNIEKKLNCDSDDSENDIENDPTTSGINNKMEEKSVDNHEELNKSLLELSRTVSEQHEISQIMRDLMNIDDLDTSLSELTEKIQYSTKASKLIEHTITSSQRLKILDDIYTANISINTCDIFSDEGTPKNSQEAQHEANLVKSPLKENQILPNDNGRKSDINDNDLNGKLISGKNISVDKKSIAKLKNVFEAEEEEKSATKFASPQKSNKLLILQENNGNSQKSNIGFVFASGKSANISFSKFLTFEKKFKEEEEKLKNMENGLLLNDSSSEKVKERKNKENESFYEDSPPKPSRKQTKDDQKEPSSLRRVSSRSLLARKPKKVKFDESSIINVENSKSNADSPSKSFNNSVKNQENVGFTFASGKNIQIETTSIMKFKNIFEIEDSKMQLDEENLIVPSSDKQNNVGDKQNIGFIFASGRSANIAGSKLLDFEKKFMEEEEKLKKMENGTITSKDIQNAPNTNVASIKVQENVPSNLSRQSSSQEIENGSNLMRTRSRQKDDEENSSQNKNSSSLRRVKSRSVFEKRPKKLKTDENVDNNQNVTDIVVEIEPSPSINKELSVNEKESIREKSQEYKFVKNTEVSGCGFVFASGKNLSINQSKLSNFKRKFEEIEKENDTKDSSPSKMPTDIPEKSQTSKTSVENTIDTVSSDQSSSKIVGDSGLSVHHSFRMSRRRTQKSTEEKADVFNFNIVRDTSTYSTRDKKNSQSTIVKKVGDSGIESQDRLTNKVESPQPIFKNKFSAFFAPSFTSSPVVKPSALKSRKLSEKFETKELPITPISAFKRKLQREPSKVRDDDDDIIMPFRPIAAKRLALENETMISPIVDIKRQKRYNDVLPKNNEKFRPERMTLSQRLAEFDEYMAYESQLALFANDPTASQFNSILEIEQHHLSKFEAENKIKCERVEAIKEQMDYVSHKPSEDSRQMTGTIYMMKSGSNRMKINDYVENEQPHEKNIHSITYDELANFKFDMKHFVSDASLKVSIIVGDNAKIVFDESSKIGYKEIMNGFLASPGVDPKLIKLEWIENAYKMILSKFLWMENSFEKIDKFEVLTPENVLLQLKYRYDREIDRHQRPAIRKITELDEIPSRRIVLKVLNILYTLDAGYELELSDGWYKIRSCIDSCLAEAIAKKKIAINSKLIICNSELVNIFSSGYHPLDLPAGVRLKIHGNSSRFAPWHTKLGFCKNPRSYLMSLNSVSCDGGVIGRMKLFIVHVYNIVYVESNGEKKEFRSEKMQNRIENKKEIMYSTIYEKIQKQIMQETYNELKERVAKIDKKKIVLSNMPIQDICDILEYESESDLSCAIKCQMTMIQMEKVREVFDQRRFELNQKIKDRINKSENSVAQLLKFRVVDANNPKKTALISWWQPTDELMNIIKQGNVIEIFKTSSVGKFQAMCSGEMQIHADRSTVVKLSKPGNDIDKFSKFIRRETKFEDITRDFSPMNNEFDISCMIIHIGESQNDGKLQKVYVADENMNFISLNFYPSLSEYAYEDVLIEGKILYIRNLQWRRLFKDNNIQLPEAHAIIDSTIFISNPRVDAQKERLETFANRIGDITDYTQKCREKLETFIGKILPKSKVNSHTVINFVTPVPFSLGPRSKNRVLGMKKIPYKYHFS